MFKRNRSFMGLLLALVLAFALLPVQTIAAPVLNKYAPYTAQRATATPTDDVLKTFNNTRTSGFAGESGGTVEQTKSFLTDKQRELIKQQKSRQTAGGLVGFTGEYELNNPNKTVKIIVELAHPPAEVAAAYAAYENRPVTYSSLDNAAKEDKFRFYEDLDRILPMPMNGSGSYEVTADWSTAINGVAVTLPAFAVEELAKSPAVKAIYPDRIVSVSDTTDESVSENPTITDGAENTPPEENTNERSDENSDEELDESEEENRDEELDEEQGDQPEKDKVQEPKELLRPNLFATPGTGPGVTMGMDDTREQLGVDRLHGQGLSGEGVSVLVIDTGIDYNHPDLKHVYKGGLNFVNYPPLQRAEDDPMETTYKDWLNIPDYDRPEETVNDLTFYTSHGTHVAGIIAATGENSPVSALGVAPKVDLYVFRALGPYGSGETSWIVSALDKIPNYNVDIDVVNLSLGVPSDDPLDPNSIAVNNVMLMDSDIVFCVAAGNSGPNLRTLGSPAVSPLAITVGNGTTPVTGGRFTAVSGEKTVVLNKFFTDWVSKFQPDGTGAYVSNYTHLNNTDGQMKLVATALDDNGNPVGYGYSTEFTDEVKSAVAGNVAVVLRGNYFEDTMKNAIQAGAGAVLLIQDGHSDPASLGEFRGYGTDYLPMFTIPDNQEGLEFFAEAQKNEGFFKITEIGNNEGVFLNQSSSRGPVGATDDIKPDLVGPGTGVLSTVPYFIVDKTLEENNPNRYDYAYQSYTGTSMASPHIAGVAALMVEYSRENHVRWNAQEIKSRLMSTAKDMAPPTDSGYKEYSVHEIGTGFADAYRAVHQGITVDIPYSDNIPNSASLPDSGSLSSACFGFYQLGDRFISTELEVNLSGLGSGKSYYVVAEPNTNAVEVKQPFIDYNGTPVPLIPFINNADTVYSNYATVSSDASGSLTFKLTNGGDGKIITEGMINEALKAQDLSSLGSYEGYVWIIPAGGNPENWIQGRILTVPDTYKDAAYKIPYSFRFREAPPAFALAEAIRPLLPVYGSHKAQIKESKAGVTSYASDFYWVQARKLESLYFIVTDEENNELGELGVKLDTSNIMPEALYSANQLITGKYYAYDNSGRISENSNPTNLLTGLYNIKIVAEYLDSEGIPAYDTTGSFPIYIDDEAPYATKGIENTVKKSGNTWESIYTEKDIRELAELTGHDKARWFTGFYVKDDGLTLLHDKDITQALFDYGNGPLLMGNHYIGAVYNVEVDGVPNDKWEMITALYDMGAGLPLNDENPAEGRTPKAYSLPSIQSDGNDQDNYLIAINLLEDELKDRKNVKITVRLIDLMTDTVISTLAGDQNVYVDAPFASTYYNTDTWAFYGANISDEIVINVKYGGLGE